MTLSAHWRRIRGSKVRHGFFPREPGAFTPSRCGNSPVWFDPDGWLGADDPDLMKMRPCSRCLRLLLVDQAGMLDFPTGWRIVRRGLIHRTPKCSYIQTWGGSLCDCGAMEREWERLVAAGGRQ